MTIDAERIVQRRATWDMASDLVAPLVEFHGVEDYSIGQLLNQTSKFTKVDQHLEHILRVADWLLE